MTVDALVHAPELFRHLPEPYFSNLFAAVRKVADARGGDVVDLARGNPDIPPPQHIIDALTRSLAPSTAHGYPPFAGLPELRQAFVEHQRDVFGIELDPEREVVVVPGTKTAITLCCMALAGSGRSVIVPDPGYADYPSGVALSGAVQTSVHLDPDSNFAPAWSTVDEVALRDAGMCFLNYPANPCGSAATPELFDEAIAWSQSTGVPIVHDLAYGELVFGNHKPLSFLARPGARERGVEMVSMSKTYGMAGWRLGFVAGNTAIIERIRTLLDHLTVGVFIPIQHAGIAALTEPQQFVADIRSEYERRTNEIADRLGLKRCDGSYYLWWKLPAGLTVEKIREETGVSLAPGEGFGGAGAGWARISATAGVEAISEACTRLEQYL